MLVRYYSDCSGQPTQTDSNTSRLHTLDSSWTMVSAFKKLTVNDIVTEYLVG